MQNLITGVKYLKYIFTYSLNKIEMYFKHKASIIVFVYQLLVTVVLCVRLHVLAKFVRKQNINSSLCFGVQIHFFNFTDFCWGSLKQTSHLWAWFVKLTRLKNGLYSVLISSMGFLPSCKNSESNKEIKWILFGTNLAGQMRVSMQTNKKCKRSFSYPGCQTLFLKIRN